MMDVSSVVKFWLAHTYTYDTIDDRHDQRGDCRNDRVYGSAYG